MKFEARIFRLIESTFWSSIEGEIIRNEEVAKFIENNMFASKRLNLFVEYSG